MQLDKLEKYLHADLQRMLDRCLVEADGNIVPAVTQLVECLGGVIAHHVWADRRGIGCSVRHSVEDLLDEINAGMQKVANDELQGLCTEDLRVTGKVIPFRRSALRRSG